MDRQERIIQCEKDIEVLQNQLEELKKPETTSVVLTATFSGFSNRLVINLTSSMLRVLKIKNVKQLVIDERGHVCNYRIHHLIPDYYENKQPVFGQFVGG